MKWLIVSVRDSALESFNRPWVVPARGAAVRSFQDEVNREAADNQMFQHPADFELFELGEFDDSTGAVSSVQFPVSLVKGSSVERK